jgi:PIN domain nuclease of toxin-antitoxin system
VRVLLDTNVLLTAVMGGSTSLKTTAREILPDADSTCLLSSISITEILVKRSIGKLELDPDVMDDGYADAGLKLIAA